MEKPCEFLEHPNVKTRTTKSQAEISEGLETNETALAIMEGSKVGSSDPKRTASHEDDDIVRTNGKPLAAYFIGGHDLAKHVEHKLEDWEFIKRVNLDDLKELCPQGQQFDEFIKPFDYMEMFQPKTPEEIRKFIGISAPIGSEDAPMTKQNNFSDDIPESKKAEAKSLQDLI